MEHEHTLSALIRKRAEIAGHIEAAQDKLRALQTDLAHVEAVARMFQPNINLSGVKVRPVPGHAAALYGEMTKAVFQVLRRTDRPLSVREIAFKVMEQRGLAVDDGALVKNMHNRVGAALRTAKSRGNAVSDRGHGLELVWRLNPM